MRRYLRRRRITARIAQIGRGSSQRLGHDRWVGERSIDWLLSYKRLALRYDRTRCRPTPWPVNRPGIDGGFQPPKDGSHGGTEEVPR